MNRLNSFLLNFSQEGRETLRLKSEVRMVFKERMSIRKAQKLTNKLAGKFEGLKESDIGKWRKAHAMALNSENPVRYDLYNIYRDVLLDDHLKGVIKVRLEKLLKSEFQIVDTKSGEVDVEASELFKKRWFWQFMTYSWNAHLYGYTLIQFGDIVQTENGFEFKDVEEVDRRFIRPESGTFVLEPYDEKGFSYKKGAYTNWLLEVGTKNELGLLLEAAPLAISKKYMGIFWDEFAELFATPMVIGRTNMDNKTEKAKLGGMLEGLTRRAWGVFGKDTDIEIVETQKKDAYMVYDKRMERTEKGMSKLVLGSTMIVDNGSSHSQSKVHEQVTEDIVNSDKREMMFTINEDLIPFLKMHGYPLEGKKFKWDESERLTLKEQADIDKWLIQYFDIDVDYFKKKYNSSILDFKKPTGKNPDDSGK